MLHLVASCVDRRMFCRGACKKYAVDGPAGKGQYGEGQAHCPTCDVWVGAKGARLKDGTIATVGSVGWHCRCCAYRLRMRTRNVRYGSRLGAASRVGAGVDDGGAPCVDLSYFNRLRGDLLRRLAAVLPEGREDVVGSGLGYFPVELIRHIENEFGDMGELLDLAYDINPPNKISMVVEFERVKSNLDGVPSKHEFEKVSLLNVDVYDREFDSWENFLDKMGHDPWYRNTSVTNGDSLIDSRSMSQMNDEEYAGGVDREDQIGHDDATTLREKIRSMLEDDLDALRIFGMLESDIDDVDPAVLRLIADEVGSD